MIWAALIIITIFILWGGFITIFADDDQPTKDQKPPTPLFDRLDIYEIRGKQLRPLELAKSELISESYTLKKADIALLGYDIAVCDKETMQVHFYNRKKKPKSPQSP